MQQLGLRGVRRAVIDLFSLPAAHDQAAAAQGPQVVGHRRARHVQQGGNVDHALLRVAQKPKHADPRGVAELLENVRHALKPVHPQQLRLQMREMPGRIVVMGQRQVVHSVFPSFAYLAILFARLAVVAGYGLTCVFARIILQP